MKIAKKFFCILLCAIICLSVSISTLAANDIPKIKISSVDVMPGNTVTINIEISNNPGIMAMAFCITYDNDALIYKNYSKGYLSSYTVKDHNDKGHISFVNVENGDVKTNGTIISLLFEVKENAKPGKHVISLANSNRDKHGNKLHNSFSNSKQEYIIPAVASGGVTVGENCNNAGHSYSEWNIVYPATCTATGLRNRLCTRCSSFDEEQIPASHDFEADWTIDKAATPEEDGEMSRHCANCDQVTDKITFKYEEIGGDEGDTSSDISSDSTSSSDASSSTNTDNDTSIDSSDASNTSSQPTTGQKPVINNQVGQKVPLQEAEKFEDYQQNIKPNLNSSDTQSNDTSSEQTPSQTTPSSSDTTIGATQSNSTVSNPDDSEPSFYKTPVGIIMIAVCSILSIGILALGVLLIIRNKKSIE